MLGSLAARDVGGEPAVERRRFDAHAVARAVEHDVAVQQEHSITPSISLVDTFLTLPYCQFEVSAFDVLRLLMREPVVRYVNSIQNHISEAISRICFFHLLIHHFIFIFEYYCAVITQLERF